MDHIRALKVFCAVVDANSLAGAARMLSMSAPSVTRVINELEAHLATPLLKRTTRSVTLTDVGATYLPNARRILEEVQAADDIARGARIKPTGTLRITASILFGQYYIAPIIRDYIDRFPDVKVEGVFVDRLVSIIDEGFDIAVRIGPLKDSSLKAIRVGSVHHATCGHADYFEKNGIPQHPRDLINHNIIHFDGLGYKRSWKFDDGLMVNHNSRLGFSTIAPCISTAKSGWGLTRVLSYQVGPELNSGELQTVLESYSQQEWPVHLVHTESRLQSAKVRSFLDIATEHLRKNPILNPS